MAIIVVVPIIIEFIIDIHPQLLIGLFQGYQNQNSFEPRNGATPGRSTKENGTEPGHGYLSDLKNDKLAQKCYTAMVEFLKEN